jgi:molybdopterin converting factor small subunit
MALVRYWAGARALAGAGEQEFAGASVAEVLQAVRAAHGAAMGRLIDSSVLLLDNRQLEAGVDEPLTARSVLEVLPPYAGG